MSNVKPFEDKRKKKPQTGMRIIRYLPTALIFIFAVLVCSLVITVGSRVLAGGSNFCSLNSQVVQVMLVEAKTWLASFPDEYSPAEPKSRSFSLQNNTGTFLAQGYWDNPKGKPLLLYVITGSDIDGLNGSQGYIYTPSGTIESNFWLDNYWITRLNENIYCYKIA